MGACTGWICKKNIKLDSLCYVLLIPDNEDIIHLKNRFIQYINNKHGNRGIILANSSLISKLVFKSDGILFTKACICQ